MPEVPQQPQPGKRASRSRNPGPWIDLIAFLGVLSLGGVLMALGRTTAGSLATICAALGALYAVWKHFRVVDGSPNTDEASRKPDEHPR
jgi:hypothetical protein